MKILGMTIAAAVAITMFSIPSVSFGIECRALCNSGPPPSLISDSGDDRDECQRKIDDSGGFCTNNGKLNLGKDLPRGMNYRPQDYHPRRTFNEVFGF